MAHPKFLADTNLACMAIKRRLGRLKTPWENAVADWYEVTAGDGGAAICFATVAELMLWALSRRDPTDKARVAAAVTQFLASAYRLQSSDAMTRSWAMIAREARLRGRMPAPGPIGAQVNDIWIAACAHACGMTLLTCDAGFGWMAEVGVDARVFAT
jgi:predicted nucleic acid-binding protein